MHGGLASDCPHRSAMGTRRRAGSLCHGDAQFRCESLLPKWIADMLGAQDKTTGHVPSAPLRTGLGWCGLDQPSAYALNFTAQWLPICCLKFRRMTEYIAIKPRIRWIMFSKRTNDGKILKYNPANGSPGDLPADEMVHTFYFWRCADLTQTAKVLVKPPRQKYAGLAEQTRKLSGNVLRRKTEHTGKRGNIFKWNGCSCRPIPSCRCIEGKSTRSFDTGILVHSSFSVSENGCTIWLMKPWTRKRRLWALARTRFY